MSTSRPTIGISTLERASRSDPDAWRALYRAVYPAVAFLLGKQSPDVEDVAQEALCKILSWVLCHGFEQSHFFPATDDDAHVERWVKTIARHAAIDHLRRNKTATSVLSIEEVDAILDTYSPSITDLIFLRKAMSQLTEEQRAIFILYYVEGLTQQEICVRLGIPVNTVKSRLSRTTALMRPEADEPRGGATAEGEGDERKSISGIVQVVRDDQLNTVFSAVPREAAARRSEGRK